MTAAGTTRTPRIVLLLDRSGSMASCRENALAGVNGYLREVADDPALIGGRITLLTFDNESIDTVRDDVALAVCPPLETSEFVPRGATPLLDAVAKAVSLLDGYEGRADDPRILVVLTDGYENASQEHTRASVSALLKARQAAGWLVLYLGANQDSWAEAQQLGVERSAVADISFERPDQIACMLSASTQRFVSLGTRGFSEDERAKGK
jgi:Mg-chelatase subunit ChlD